MTQAYYSDMSQQLQSRLAKRASKITMSVMWRDGYKALNRKKDFLETRKALKELDKAQKLDSKLLKLVQACAYEEMLFDEQVKCNSGDDVKNVGMGHHFLA